MRWRQDRGREKRRAKRQRGKSEEARREKKCFQSRTTSVQTQSVDDETRADDDDEREVFLSPRRLQAIVCGAVEAQGPLPRPAGHPRERPREGPRRGTEALSAVPGVASGGEAPCWVFEGARGAEASCKANAGTRVGGVSACRRKRAPVTSSPPAALRLVLRIICPELANCSLDAL